MFGVLRPSLPSWQALMRCVSVVFAFAVPSSFLTSTSLLYSNSFLSDTQNVVYILFGTPLFLLPNLTVKRACTTCLFASPPNSLWSMAQICAPSLRSSLNRACVFGAAFRLLPMAFVTNMLGWVESWRANTKRTRR